MFSEAIEVPLFSNFSFAQTVRIKLVSPQTAQLSILFRKINIVAPPRGT